jgi:bifunctional N-acetylglucosamine-1-phosphate-uridyltransferase/glucosamine-1-phosphate-acetyltransferase GlmU-like protein
MRRDPYIHFVRDAAGRILQVQQRREGEISVPVGENDCGMFLFKSARLFEVIGDHMSKSVATGAQTGEFNLLPLLPLFDDGNGSTQTLRIADEDETLGVNTQDEAIAAERVLASRKMEAAHV